LSPFGERLRTGAAGSTIAPMGSLSFSEIIVIVLVILIVFGPRRLPELARKAGELMGKVRNASSLLSDSLGTEYEATIEPIKSVKRDFDGIKDDLTRAVASYGTGAPSEPHDRGTEDARTVPDAAETEESTVETGDAEEPTDSS